jgi:hypothetical protein
MTRRVWLGVLLCAGWGQLAGALPAHGAEKMLAHDVFFTLHERTDPAREKLVAACEKYLADHEGVVYFAVGTVADELDRPVNDRDWDVALHIYFRDRAAHDKYQDHPQHLKFIEENKQSWSKVRVFDSYVRGGAVGNKRATAPQ